MLPAGESLFVGGVELSQLRAQYELDKAIKVLGPFVGRLNNAGECAVVAAGLAADAAAEHWPGAVHPVEKVKYSSTAPGQ